MALPLSPPLTPMLAKAVGAIPEQDSVTGGLSYEPKWDGFRAIVFFDGETVELGSRGSKMLTRYFPELVASLAGQLPGPCVIDGEIVLRTGEIGGEHLDWEALSQRIHPAASRIDTLSKATPASFVGFDLLADETRSLLNEPFAERRARLESLLGGVDAPLHLTRTTTDAAIAHRWFETFEGAGLDGVVAKPLAAPYTPGKRVMLKSKHSRTADVVLLGYRVHTSGIGVGSLLLGLHDTDGALVPVGGASAFTDVRRRELIDELAPLVLRDENGEPLRGDRERTRFSGSKDTSFVPVSPERVLEVTYDQMEGLRFRHSAQFLRWRPDRDAASCGFDQLDRPIAYDLDAVFG